MKRFKCYDCGKIFNAKGKQKNYNDAVYGPCSVWTARCPSCGEEARQLSGNEARTKKSENAAPCGNYSSCSCCGGM